MTSNMGAFRGAVSGVIQDFELKHSKSHNWTIYNDIIGWRAKKGRTGVHVDYAQALLDYKIIVTAQRDVYEDHWRLFEALISGALVFTDPMLDYPYGIEDGTNIIVYKSFNDLQDKLYYYLTHDKERKEIARNGRIMALEHHRSWHRWEDLILGDWSIRDEYGISIG